MKLNNAFLIAPMFVRLGRALCPSVVFCLALVFSSAVALAGPRQSEQGAHLSREIHHEIVTLPFYSVFDYITFTLQGRKVILTGQVLRPTLKNHAEEAIKNIEGVSSVDNQIEVLPKLATDNEVRRSVYRAIYEDSVLATYAVERIPSIRIIVKNAQVTLEGSTKSQSDRNLAASRAKSVSGVQVVKNNLIVPSSSDAAE